MIMMMTWKIMGGFGNVNHNDDEENNFDSNENYDDHDDLEYLRWVGWAHCNAIAKASSRACVWVLVVIINIIKGVVII